MSILGKQEKPICQLRPPFSGVRAAARAAAALAADVKHHGDSCPGPGSAWRLLCSYFLDNKILYHKSKYVYESPGGRLRDVASRLQVRE